MVESPFFSVVIPAYNAAAFIGQALQGILDQSDQDFEIIIVDNHSSDNTAGIVSAFDDARLSMIKIHNEGIISRSRNIGTRAARGQWVAIMDADDQWYAEKLAVVRRYIAEDSEAILFCHDMALYKNGAASGILHCGPREPDMFKALMLRGNVLIPAAVCVKKDVWLESGGFSEDERFVTVEDYEFWLRLASKGRFVFIPEVLGAYHLHDSNTSKLRVEQQASAIVAVVGCALETTDSYRLKDWQRQSCLGRAYVTASRLLQKNGLFPQARPYLFKGLRKWPFQWKGWAVAVLLLLKWAR